jgi:hypothetical protein
LTPLLPIDNHREFDNADSLTKHGERFAQARSANRRYVNWAASTGIERVHPSIVIEATSFDVRRRTG